MKINMVNTKAKACKAKAGKAKARKGNARNGNAGKEHKDLNSGSARDKHAQGTTAQKPTQKPAIPPALAAMNLVIGAVIVLLIAALAATYTYEQITGLSVLNDTDLLGINLTFNQTEEFNLSELINITQILQDAGLLDDTAVEGERVSGGVTEQSNESEEPSQAVTSVPGSSSPSTSSTKMPEPFIRAADSKGKEHAINARIARNNASGNEYDIDVEPALKAVKRLNLRNVKYDEFMNMGLEDIDAAGRDDPVEWKQLYAIDLSNLDFSEGEATVVAQGEALYKCKDWNFTSQTCFGDWVRVMDIVPGEEYVLPLSPVDPGYGEAVTDAYYMFQTTDPTYPTYRRLLNATVGGTIYTSTAIDLSAVGVKCWPAQWITDSWGTDASVNGTWSFSVYGSCTSKSPQGYLFARFIKQNSTGAWNFRNSTQSSVILCDQLIADAITLSTITYSLPFSHYTELSSGERIGVSYCLNQTVKANNQNAYIYWEGARPSNVNIPISYWDAVQPVVTLVAPPNQTSTYDTYLNFTYTVTDKNPISECSLIVDGLVNATDYTVTRGVQQNLSTMLGPGTYNWYINCTDMADNTGMSETREITILAPTDPYPPYWSNNRTYPYSPATYSLGQSYQFNVTWQDNFLVDNVTIEHNFTGTRANYTVSTFLGSEYYYNYPTLAAGSYYWKEYAYDNSSNKNSTPAWPYVVNKAASSVNLLLNGVDGDVMIYQGQYVNHSAYRVAGEGNIYLYRNGTLMNSGNGPLINITQYLVPGYHNITVVQPATKNYTPSYETHYITVQADNEAPNVTNPGAIPPMVGYGEYINFTADVTDNVGVASVIASIKLPNGSTTNFTMANIGGDTYLYSCYVSTDKPLGTYNVTFYAYDYVGNVNNTEWANFTIYDSPPIFYDYGDYPDPVVEGYNVTVWANVTDNTAIHTVDVEVNGNNYTAQRNKTIVQTVLKVTTSTGDCVFEYGSTAAQANTSDNYRSLINGPSTCGWNVDDLSDPLFAGVKNMTVHVEHVGETGVDPTGSTLYVGNATATTAYGSTALSQFEGSSNALEASQGAAVTGEGTNTYVTSSTPQTVQGINNLQLRILHTDSNDMRGVDHMYLALYYYRYTDVYYAKINTSSFPAGYNNYTIYANDTIGQTSKVNGSFYVKHILPPTWSNNRTKPPSPWTYNATQPYQFNVTWTDNGVVSLVKIEHNFTGNPANYTVSTVAGNEYYYNYGALAAGTYYWKEYAVDNDMFWNYTPSWPYVVNKAASSVNLLLNGVDGNVMIYQGQYVNKTGYRVAGEGDIRLYQNGTLLNSGPGPLTNVTQYNSTGVYNITVVYPVTKNYTGSYETHYITVQADNDAPNVTNPAATPSFIGYGEDLNLTADVTDNVGVASVIASIRYPNGTISNQTMSENGGDTYIYSCYTATDKPLGTYNVTFYAYDYAGNVNNTEWTNFTIYDSPPVFNFYDAVPDPVAVNTTLTIYANVTDNTAVDSVIVYVNGSNHTAYQNITSRQRTIPITTSTGDCVFAGTSLASYANLSDNYRSLIETGDTCGWNLGDLQDNLFIGFNNITVYVEHVAETGVTPLSSVLYVGNSTSSTAYGSTTLSTYEGDQNQLEEQQGLSVTGEGTNIYVLPSIPSTLQEFNNMQTRIYNGDAGGSDRRGVDRIYLVVNYNISSDVYLMTINATWYPLGINNYTIYANDSYGQWSYVNGTFRVDYAVPPVVNITAPYDYSSYYQGDPINFSGLVTDFEDGNITGDALVWSSNIDGQIGTGNDIIVATLSPGNHTVTLTATDSFGLTGTDTVHVEVKSYGCPGMEAGWFTLVNITIDGNVTDWDAVLQNPNNQIYDGVSGIDDLDVTQSADKDLRRYAVTWNDEWLWMYVRRSATGANVMGLDTYFDYDQDSLLETTDKVLGADWSGSSQLYSTTLYDYVPLNASGDPITGDGIPEPGTVANGVPLESKIKGGTDSGIVLEYRVRWSQLGLPACTPIIAHVSSVRGTSASVPQSVEDNMASFDTRIYGIDFYDDSIKSGKQGTTVTHIHTLRNLGNLPDLFNFNITGTRPGYNVTVYYANGTQLTDNDGDGKIDTGYILPSYGVTLYVKVSIPVSAVSGDIDVTTLTAQSKGRNETYASVTDTTVVGSIAVIPNNAGLATNGSTVSYHHTVYNNDIATTINLNATSSRGYPVTIHYANGTQIQDTNSDTIPDVGYVASGTSVPIIARIYVSPAAIPGQKDTTTINAASTFGEYATAVDNTTIAPILSIVPNITKAGGQGTSTFLVHYVTYASNESAVVDVQYNQSYGFETHLYHDDYITPLTDTDGNGIVDLGYFGTNGAVKILIVKVVIPKEASINTTEILEYNVTTNSTYKKGTAMDQISVQKLVTYRDSNWQIQSYYFKQTQTVYAQAYALDMAFVYFQYIDPNATVKRLSPAVPVDTLDQADDNLYLNATQLSGQWQLVLYDKSGPTEITRINYWVNTPPVVRWVNDTPDPVYQGETVNFTANITAGELRWFPNETLVKGALLEIAGINYTMTQGTVDVSGQGIYYFDGLNTLNLTPGLYTYKVYGFDNFTFYNVSAPETGQLTVKFYNITNVSGVITDSYHNIVNSSIYIYNSTGDLVVTDDEIYAFVLDRNDRYTVSVIPDDGNLEELRFVNVTFPLQLVNFTRLEDNPEYDMDKPEELYNWTEAISWWTHPSMTYLQTRLNFSYGADTGLYFWKCTNWDFNNRNCTNNDFFIIQNLSDGPGWAQINLTPGDPGAGAGRAPDYNESIQVWDVTGLNETGRAYNGTFVGEYHDYESINFTIGKNYRIEVFVTQYVEKTQGILRDPYYDNIPDDWTIDVNGTDAANITAVNGSVVIHPFTQTIVTGTEPSTQKLIWDAAPPNKTISDIDANETVKLWFVVDIPLNVSNVTHTGHFLGKSKGLDAEITNNLTIFTGQAPYPPMLIYPNNHNNTLTNRTITFIWNASYDPDNQTLTYSINITSQYCSDIYDTGIAATNYTPVYELGTYDVCGWYNWTVRAYDGYFYSNWSENWEFAIQPYVAMYFINDTVDFGSAENDQTNDTTDNQPPPFVLRSDSNVFIDVDNVTANQSFFLSESALDSDFQIKADSTAEEPGAFNITGSAINWINLTTIQTIIDYLDWHDHNDTAEIDVKVHVPLDEPAGVRVTGLVFYGAQP